MTTKTVARFQRMSLEEIGSQPVGKWSDSDLLDVLADLSDAERAETTWLREIAVRGLILRSPDHSEMVDYDALFFDQALALVKSDFDAAIATAYAGLVYCLQHDERGNAKGWLVEIAEFFVTGDEISVGIAQFARLLRGEPRVLHYYYRLVQSLRDMELYALAKEALDAISPFLTEDAEEEGAEEEGDVQRLETEQAESQASGWAEKTDDLSAIDPQALADLRAAFALTRAGQPAGKEYLSPLDQLLTAQPNAIPALYAKIIAQGQALIPELLYLAWDDSLYDRNNPAPAHALEILRSLREGEPARFVEIERWLEQAKGDWRDLLYTDFGMTGGYTQAELRDWAANADCDWLLRSSAADALVEHTRRHPEERKTIVAFLTDLLGRPGREANAEEETFTACVIGDLCRLGAKEAYPAIVQAFQEDRVDLQMVDLDYAQEKLDQPRTTPPMRRDGLYLNLTCKRCRRKRPHFVQHVTLDLGSQRRAREGQLLRYDPYVMDREIVCPKCGAKESYELQGVDALRLMLPMDGLGGFAAALAGEGARPPFGLQSFVSRFEVLVFDRPMHPLEGLAEYRRRIQRDPINADLRVRMSLLLRTLHRFADSLETVRGAYDVRPNDPEVMAFRAFAEHDFGDRAIAKRLYTGALPLLQQVMHDSEHMADLAGLVADGLIALEKGEQSAWKSMRDEQMSRSRSVPAAQEKKGKSEKKGRRR